jgi:hypothetical protein
VWNDTEHMISRSVTVEDIDELFLRWNDHLNASALYRQALRDEMQLRDVEPHELRAQLTEARELGYSLDEIATMTSRYADLQALVYDHTE